MRRETPEFGQGAVFQTSFGSLTLTPDRAPETPAALSASPQIAPVVDIDKICSVLTPSNAANALMGIEYALEHKDSNIFLSAPQEVPFSTEEEKRQALPARQHVERFVSTLIERILRGMPECEKVESLFQELARGELSPTWKDEVAALRETYEMGGPDGGSTQGRFLSSMANAMMATVVNPFPGTNWTASAFSQVAKHAAFSLGSVLEPDYSSVRMLLKIAEKP